MKTKTRKELERGIKNMWFGLLFCFLLVIGIMGLIWNSQVKDLEQQLQTGQEKIGMLENIKVTPSTFSYWQYDGNEYSNYVCIGDFYINGNKIEIPEGLERFEVGFWKGTWIWDGESDYIDCYIKENCEGVSKPDYCGEGFLDYALTEEQIKECHK